MNALGSSPLKGAEGGVSGKPNVLPAIRTKKFQICMSIGRNILPKKINKWRKVVSRDLKMKPLRCACICKEREKGGQGNLKHQPLQ